MERRAVVTGALLSGASFFLPYIRTPNLFGDSASLSGFAMGGWMWAIPLTAGVILLGHLLFDAAPTQLVALRLMLAGAGGGIAMLLFGVYELTRNRLFGASALDMGVRPGIGPILSLAGFVLAIWGARRLQLASAGTAPMLAAEAGHAEAGSFSPPPVDIAGEAARYARIAGQALARWAAALREHVGRLELHARYRRHRRSVWGGTAALGLAMAIYLLVLRPSPEKLGRSTSLAFSSCRDQYAADVHSAEQTLLQRLAKPGFRTRGEALDAWSALLQTKRPGYQDCVSTAAERFSRAQERFAGHRLERFLSTHYAQPRPALDPGALESEFVGTELLTRIQAIRAAAPGELEVRQHLLGRSVDGWSFDDASEFRALRLRDPRISGDTLRLRAEADLTDHVSQEPFVAVLELRYQMAERGDWQLAGIDPLLVARAGADYRSNGEIFLVGRWRWPVNYALYNADGTWAGRWDDGGEAAGRWRIVRDRLVLTRAGQNWWSGQIQSWSADSMRVGDGSGVLVHRWRGGGAAAPETAPPPAAAGSAGAFRRAVINDPDGYTNVRANPSANAAIVAVVRENEEISVVASAEPWWQVRTPAGASGYIHRTRVRLLP